MLGEVLGVNLVDLTELGHVSDINGHLDNLVPRGTSLVDDVLEVLKDLDGLLLEGTSVLGSIRLEGDLAGNVEETWVRMVRSEGWLVSRRHVVVDTFAFVEGSLQKEIRHVR